MPNYLYDHQTECIIRNQGNLIVFLISLLEYIISLVTKVTNNNSTAILSYEKKNIQIGGEPIQSKILHTTKPGREKIGR